MKKVKTTVSNDIQQCSIGCSFIASGPVTIIALTLILLTNLPCKSSVTVLTTPANKEFGFIKLLYFVRSHLS